MVTNPKTGRAIMVGGRAWKALVAEGVLSGGGAQPPKQRKRRDVGAHELVKRASRVAARELVSNPDPYREAMEAVGEDYGDDVGRRAAVAAETEADLESRLESMLLEDLCRGDDEWQPRRSAPRPVPKKGAPPAPRWVAEEKQPDDNVGTDEDEGDEVDPYDYDE